MVPTVYEHADSSLMLVRGAWVRNADRPRVFHSARRRRGTRACMEQLRSFQEFQSITGREIEIEKCVWKLRQRETRGVVDRARNLFIFPPASQSSSSFLPPFSLLTFSLSLSVSRRLINFPRVIKRDGEINFFLTSFSVVVVAAAAAAAVIAVAEAISERYRGRV